MKNLLIIALAVLGQMSFAMPHERMPRPKPTPKMACKSIDVTFVPFYTLQVEWALVGRNEFPVYIQVRETLGSEETTNSRHNGKGTLTKTTINLKLEDGSRLVGKKLANGIWKVDLKQGSEVEELTCRILLPH